MTMHSLARALEDASIPTLMMSMIHMSGDASLLDGPIRPAGVYINEYQGYLSEEDKATVRARALEVIKAFRAGGCRLPPPPSETMHRMVNFLVAQDVPRTMSRYSGGSGWISSDLPATPGATRCLPRAAHSTRYW
ncbi:MAG: hypothetical protein R3E50_01200 [Halioglobus sp.]